MIVQYHNKHGSFPYSCIDKVPDRDDVRMIVCTSVPQWLPVNLKILKIVNANLKHLSVSLPDGLEELILTGNSLKYLPTLPSSLKILDISNNRFKELPELPKSIEFLGVADNRLTSLNISRTNCRLLNCSRNLLPSTLSTLIIKDNQLTSIPIEIPFYIENIQYDGNPIDNVDPFIAKIYKELRQYDRVTFIREMKHHKLRDGISFHKKYKDKNSIVRCIEHLQNCIELLREYQKTLPDDN